MTEVKKMEFTYTPKTLAALKDDLDRIRKDLIESLVTARPFLSREIIDQMEFYIEILYYHFEAAYTYYATVTSDIFERITIISRDEGQVKVQLKPAIPELPDVIVFNSIHLRQLMFETYSFILIAKIMLDKINFFLSRFFKTSLPHSISKIVELTKRSDCPVHEAMQEDPLHSFFLYLIQLRDYLTHNKPFVASERGYVVRAGSELPAIEQEILDSWAHNPLLINFEIMDQGIKVNILLPDQIFADDQKTVKAFTYNTKFNLISFLGKVTRYNYLLYEGVLSVSTTEAAKKPYRYF